MRLLFFAQCAEWMKRRQDELPLDRAMTLEAALSTRADLSSLLERRSYLKVAVNQAFADYQTEVRDGDEIAFFPPFSGG